MSTVIRQPCDDGVVQSHPSNEPCPEVAAPWILAATILASSMVFLDGTIVNIALPTLQEAFHADAAQLQWIVESYALTLASLLLVGGALGDRYGRRRVFAIGVIVFSLSSACCGLVSSIAAFVAARAFQGIGGALLVPGSLAIIGASFRQENKARAIGTWSAVTAIAAAAGPLAGGWLADRNLWRWMFLLNVPIAAVVLAISFMRVPESRDDRRAGPLDVWGVALSTIGLGGVVLALVESSTRGFRDPLVVAAGVIGILGIVLFLVVEARSPSPIVPLGLFRSRTFSGANLLTLFLYAALSSMMFLLPFTLIETHGYSSTEAGAAMVPFVVLVSAFSRWIAPITARFGARIVLTVGPLVTAVGYALLAVPGVDSGPYWSSFLAGIVALGIGMGVSVAPLTTTVMAAVGQQHSGTASGINNAVSRVAAVLAIAVVSAAVVAQFGSQLTARTAGLDLSPETRVLLREQSIRLAAAEVPPGALAYEADVTRAIDESFVSAFRLAMLLSAGLAVAAALSAWLLIREKPKSESG